MNIVRILSTRFDDSKRLISKFLRNGKDDVAESFTAEPFGLDSNPIKDIRAVFSKTESTADSVIIGFINEKKKTKTGESRLFSTDENGELKIFVHLKNDGTIEFGGDVGNLTRFQELETAFNKLKDDHNALVQKWNAFVTAYVPGSPAAVGLPPTLAGSNVQPSTADMSGAKIDEFKTL